MLYAPPFTFLTLRFILGIICMLPIVLIVRPMWPSTPTALGHVIVAGVLMHAIHLGGSHYTQYLGVSAGIVAVLLAVQPLLTAVVASRWMGEHLTLRQWTGIAVGFAGVLLVVWHKIDVREMTVVTLIAVLISLLAVTAGTLYQRVFCPRVDLRASSLIQFAATAAVLGPLAYAFEDFRFVWAWQMVAAIAFLVVAGSILAVSALHTLMRHGAATRVTALFYLTPITTVLLEYLLFRVVPTPLSLVGIAVICAGVALVSWHRDAPVTE